MYRYSLVLHKAAYSRILYTATECTSFGWMRTKFYADELDLPRNAPNWQQWCEQYKICRSKTRATVYKNHGGGVGK